MEEWTASMALSSAKKVKVYQPTVLHYRDVLILQVGLMKRLSVIFIALTGFVVGWQGPLGAVNVGPMSALSGPASMEPKEILINNRILAIVGDKPISTRDVVKQLDFVFHKQYPQYENSLAARYQFYNSSWKYVAQDLLNKELVLADAADVKFPITHGEVREEMENAFGPNVMATLRKMGMSYDEAFKLMREDILLKKMMTYRVNVKALHTIGPKEVKAAYQEYLSQFPPKTFWDYQILTVRGNDERAVTAVARQAHALLLANRYSLDEVKDKLSSGALPSHVTISVSAPMQQDSESIADSISDTLTSMEPGQFSTPIAGISRADKKPMERIFFLRGMTKENPPSFADKEKELESQLFQQAMAKEGDRYMQFLKERFGNQFDLEALVPADYHPFSVR